MKYLNLSLNVEMEKERITANFSQGICHLFKESTRAYILYDVHTLEKFLFDDATI